MALLADYVIRLAGDADEAKHFASSHHSAKERMAKAGLTQEQQELLLSGDAARITAAITNELRASSGASYNHTTCTLVLNIPKPK